MFDSMTGFMVAHQVAFAVAALPILAYLAAASFVGDIIGVAAGASAGRQGIICLGIILLIVSVLPTSFFFILFDVLPDFKDTPVRLFAGVISGVAMIFGFLTSTHWNEDEG